MNVYLLCLQCFIELDYYSWTIGHILLIKTYHKVLKKVENINGATIDIT